MSNFNISVNMTKYFFWPRAAILDFNMGKSETLVKFVGEHAHKCKKQLFDEGSRIKAVKFTNGASELRVVSRRGHGWRGTTGQHEL